MEQDKTLNQGFWYISDNAPFKPKHLLTTASSLFHMPCTSSYLLLSSNLKTLTEIELKESDQEVYLPRIKYAPAHPNRIVKRLI